MGFQTFTCVICGESCTRRTSKRYGEGRACNKHEEVQTDLQNKAFERVMLVFNDMLSEYKQHVSKKHPVKDKLKTWLQDGYVKQLIVTKDEISQSNKFLTILKESKLVDLSYTVSDDFVTRAMAHIIKHEEDPDWENYTKVGHKPKQVNKPQRSKEDEKEVRFRIKEHRGAKEAPRRKSYTDKRH